MRAAQLATAALVLAMTGRAEAQPRPREPIDVERFKPAITYDAFLVTEGSDTRWPLPHDAFEIGGYLNYALNPLVVVGPNDAVVDRIVSGRLGGDVFGALTLFPGFAVALGVPFFLAQTGDDAPNVGGLGDVRVVPKYRILDDREVVGLALLAELRVPTHSDDEYSGGARNVVFAPKVALDHRFGFGLRVGVNAGVLVREGTRFENVEAASELTYSGAVAYSIGGYDGDATIGLDVGGATGLTSVDYEELPLEALLYGAVRPSDEITIQFGPGVGIVPGYGVPAFRAVVGVRWAPAEHDRDRDGIPDDEDACPDDREDRDDFRDEDGCPEDDDTRDDDTDGVVNVGDLCPTEKETINGVEDDDGCPDEGDPKVVREPGQLLVLENIEFATGSAIIRPVSYGVLDQVALMLKANPDIKLLRIEGHTDSRGRHSDNMKLSQDRADSVRRYLIGKGIDKDRLQSEGFGPDRPLVPETDQKSLQKNRRVEFIIER
jgi:outer membrane protein OmpA-like peptidoglycan-associated protein